MKERMSIAEFAAHLGVAPSTLRYYEKAGLTPPVTRNASGHRIYDEKQLRWTRFVLRLRSTGMSIRDVKEYVGAVTLGPDGDALRMNLLALHAEKLRAHLREYEDCLAVVESKLEHGCRPRESTQSNRDRPTK